MKRTQPPYGEENVARNARAMAALDSLPLSRFHWKVLGLSGVGWMFDAMDVTLLSVVMPILIATWGLTSSQAGLIASVDRIGALVGAVLAGVLADRLGRRVMFQVTLLVYSIGTGLLALTSTLLSFSAVRFLVGMGLGGELPVVATLTSELLPARQRGFLMGFFNSFFNVGFILAAVVGLAVATSMGWQAAFLVGALPALLVIVLRRYLPESPRYLIARGRVSEARQVLAAAGLDTSSITAAPAVSADTPSSRDVKLSTLLSPAYRRTTSLMGLAWFSLYFTAYAVYAWLPTLLVGRGLSYTGSLQYTLLAGAAQIMGNLVVGNVADRFGRRWTLATSLVLATGSACLFGALQGPMESLVLIMLLGFFAAGAFAVATGYTPELFETEVRGSGVGLTTGIGRIGGAIAPFTVGATLQSFPGGAGQVVVFALISAFFLLAAIAVVVLRRETSPRSVERMMRPALGA